MKLKSSRWMDECVDGGWKDEWMDGGRKSCFMDYLQLSKILLKKCSKETKKIKRGHEKETKYVWAPL